MNLDTYKVHSLGDYVETIRKYGTCDSYTTEMVSEDMTGQMGNNIFTLYSRGN